MEVKALQQEISPAQYEDVVGDDMINLAVVVEDMNSEERVLASEEFNIASPELIIEVTDEHSIVLNKEHAATVSFTNPFSHPVTGVLTVAGAGLIQGKLQFRMSPLPPGGRVQQLITFIPGMVGMKMLQASLSFTNIRSTIRGFKMLSVSSV